jgi:hypothetical protein
MAVLRLARRRANRLHEPCARRARPLEFLAGGDRLRGNIPMAQSWWYNPSLG